MYDPTKHTWLKDVIIELFSSIDKIVYALISFVYQIFFNVSTASFLSGETVKNLFSRVQLILGVAIIFRLAITLIDGIINPDKITDNKNGASKIITRVLVSLVLIVLIIPLNIPQSDIEDGSYEAQLNNNGILFGTLYEFQNRILSENTLAKLILGKANNTSDLASSESMKQAGDELAATVLKSFVTVNMDEGKENETDLGSNNRLCKESENDSYVNYYINSTNSTRILNMTTLHCNEGYVFNYMYIISTVAAVLMLIIMIGFTLDIAIRAIKLSILRLIAPIPIISYIDPKGENALSTWGKTVTHTYLDLFIRLAVVFFILFVINEFINNGIVIVVSGGLVGKLSYVVIIIGLFYFAKSAPKFLLESIGQKYEGGFFSGIGRMFAMAATGAGTLGAIATNVKTQRTENDEQYPNQRFRNALRTFGSGVSGAVSGIYTGTRAAVTANDHQTASVLKAMNSRNALRAAHSTLLGRGLDNAYSLFTGNSLANRDEDIAKVNKEAADSLKAYKSVLQEEARKSTTLEGQYEVRDASGNLVTRSFNYERLVAAMNAKDNNGNFTYNGETFNVSNFDQNVMNKILDSQSEAYRQEAFANPNDSKYGKVITQWRNTEHAITEAGLNKDYRDENGLLHNGFDGSYDNIGATIGRANSRVADMNTDMRHIRHRANTQANNNNH